VAQGCVALTSPCASLCSALPPRVGDEDQARMLDALAGPGTVPQPACVSSAAEDLAHTGLRVFLNFAQVFFALETLGVNFVDVFGS